MSGEKVNKDLGAAPFLENGAVPTGSKPQNDAPQAGFTDNQWYCHQARQTVFFTAFSLERSNRAAVEKIAADLARLAPQLNTGFIGARPAEPLTKEIIGAICDVKTVDDLSGYPQDWDLSGDEIFDTPDLPLFRIKAVVRRDGPDENGHASCILVISTHALLEGADAILLSRSRTVPRGMVTAKPNKTPLLQRLRFSVTAALLVPVQMLAAYFLSARTPDVSYRGIALERGRLRRVASAMGLSQRSLIFALVTYALNNGGKGFSRRKISAIYTDLDAASDRQTNDEFFQFRLIDLKLDYESDFAIFAKNVHSAIAEIESRDVTKTQAFINAMFATHRRVSRFLPFMYTPRFFRFTAGYDLSLSLMPPQLLAGEMTRGLMEPIYCGTFHPGMNLCVFAPGKTHITINLSLHARLVPHVEKIEALLEEIDPS